MAPLITDCTYTINVLELAAWTAFFLLLILVLVGVVVAAGVALYQAGIAHAEGERDG